MLSKSLTAALLLILLHNVSADTSQNSLVVTSVRYIHNGNFTNQLKFLVDETRTLQVNLRINFSNSTSTVQVKFQSSDDRVTRIVWQNDTRTMQPRQESDGNYTIVADCELKGIRLGKSNLQIYVRINTSDSWRSVQLTEDQLLNVIILRERGILDDVYRGILIAMVIIMTTCMGASLEVKVLKEIFKKPIAPAIGFFCQFVIMPNLSFAIGQATGIAKEFALGLLTMGCAPGGGNSNAWTLLLNGDLTLSITMTFISNVAALAMMPLWMFVYARFYMDFDKVKIPFDQIALTLLQVLIPALVGLFIKTKIPKLANICQKIVKPLTIFFIIYVLTFGTYVNIFIYILIGQYPQVIPVGALLPWVGFLLGYLVSFLLRQPQKRRVTIALETGFQNVAVPILVLLYSMPAPDGDLGAIVPIIIALSGPLPLYFIGIGKCILRRKVEKEKVAAQETQEYVKEPSAEKYDLEQNSYSTPV